MRVWAGTARRINQPTAAAADGRTAERTGTITAIIGTSAAVSLVLLSGCLTDAGTGTGTPAIIGHPFQNEPTGFRNIEWGARLNSISDKMTLLGREKNVEKYARPGDKLNFGDAQLASIHYNFYKGQLKGVYIESKSGAMTAMVNTFQAQFGPGFQANPYIPRYLWNGTNTTIFLACSEATLSCQGVIDSVRVEAEQKADDAVAARGAKQDF
jgi:hypothetical protein